MTFRRASGRERFVLVRRPRFGSLRQSRPDRVQLSIIVHNHHHSRKAFLQNIIIQYSRSQRRHQRYI
ncbi:hypothetical protein HETIRDRAFT_327644 [Heterobasidion irregulare TC 32-1]|uniref:Uncharacterized protein n=1 Tax=Heterobasidion irregulare (strain TC 32-1) TaxID=747525 RepID=W4JW21_HETIT|nr:uncharacterized protein HETIRDRAFT_327644 [Heterobasidion irregulare TC 32-1]ETW77076.1 hypothetical protein HETIRDRAFT_327644 [Heterobasidion irregulare TC 32-1]